MSNTAQQDPAISEVDDAIDEGRSKAQKLGPSKQRQRYRMFDDGQGDFRIYQLVAEEAAAAPKGSLIPLPHAPGFMSSAEAKKWLRNNGDTCAGLQLMLFKGVELIHVGVMQRSAVVLTSKPRHAIDRPTPPSPSVS